MARPTKPAAVKLSKLVQFRTTDAELSQLEEAAKASEMTVADFCRSRILGSKPRRKKTDPERQALIAALGTLGNIRADINQVLKDRFSYKFVKLKAVDDVFAAIETIAAKIQNDLGNGN